MKRKFRDYQEKLIQDLQDPELATAYLNVALTDEDPPVFLLALKNVCEAQLTLQATNILPGCYFLLPIVELYLH
jgi:DNA-binding phage protein